MPPVSSTASASNTPRPAAGPSQPRRNQSPRSRSPPRRSPPPRSRSPPRRSPSPVQSRRRPPARGNSSIRESGGSDYRNGFRRFQRARSSSPSGSNLSNARSYNIRRPILDGGRTNSADGDYRRRVAEERRQAAKKRRKRRTVIPSALKYPKKPGPKWDGGNSGGSAQGWRP